MRLYHIIKHDNITIGNNNTCIDFKHNRITLELVDQYNSEMHTVSR